MTIDDSPLPLADDTDASTALGTEGGAADPQSGAPSGAGGASPGAQLADLLRGAIAPLAEENARYRAATDAQLHELRAQLAQLTPRQQQAVAAATGSANIKDALLESFVADPEAFRRSIIEEAAKATAQQIAPYLHGPAQAAQTVVLDKQQARVDRLYGAGTYDKVVRPHLETVIGNMPEPLRYNEQALTRSVDALLGSEELRPALEQARETSRRAQAEAAKKRPPNPFGAPSRSIEGGEPVVTNEDRAVMDALERSGFKLSEDRLLTLRKLPKGANLDEMLEAEERLTPRKKGAA